MLQVWRPRRCGGGPERERGRRGGHRRQRGGDLVAAQRRLQDGPRQVAVLPPSPARVRRLRRVRVRGVRAGCGGDDGDGDVDGGGGDGGGGDCRIRDGTLTASLLRQIIGLRQDE